MDDFTFLNSNLMNFKSIWTNSSPTTIGQEVLVTGWKQYKLIKIRYKWELNTEIYGEVIFDVEDLINESGAPYRLVGSMSTGEYCSGRYFNFNADYDNISTGKGYTGQLATLTTVNNNCIIPLEILAF